MPHRKCAAWHFTAPIVRSHKTQAMHKPLPVNRLPFAGVDGASWHKMRQNVRYRPHGAIFVEAATITTYICCRLQIRTYDQKNN
jgi:hypothetical protein